MVLYKVTTSFIILTHFFPEETHMKTRQFTCIVAISQDRTNFLWAQLGTQKMGKQNQIVCKMEIQIETLLFVLYYLNRTWIIVMLQTYPSKDAQKNMVKAWKFTKNKICHICFDNNLQKLFRRKSLRAATDRYFG